MLLCGGACCCVFFVMIRGPPRSTLTDTGVPDTSLFRSAAAAGHQADAEALRVSEDFRRLQSQVQLLHHPVDARQAVVAPGRRCVARSREAGEVRRAGTAGDLAGHLGLRRSEEHTSELQSLKRNSYAVA